MLSLFIVYSKPNAQTIKNYKNFNLDKNSMFFNLHNVFKVIDFSIKELICRLLQYFCIKKYVHIYLSCIRHFKIGKVFISIH